MKGREMNSTNCVASFWRSGERESSRQCAELAEERCWVEGGWRNDYVLMNSEIAMYDVSVSYHIDSFQVQRSANQLPIRKSETTHSLSDRQQSVSKLAAIIQTIGDNQSSTRHQVAAAPLMGTRLEIYISQWLTLMRSQRMADGTVYPRGW